MIMGHKILPVKFPLTIFEKDLVVKIAKKSTIAGWRLTTKNTMATRASREAKLVKRSPPIIVSPPN